MIIGQALWFAQNLNYETPDSRCQGDLAANCAVHGRLYRWDEADTGFDALFSGYSDPHLGDVFVRLGERAAF